MGQTGIAQILNLETHSYPQSMHSFAPVVHSISTLFPRPSHTYPQASQGLSTQSLDCSQTLPATLYIRSRTHAYTIYTHMTAAGPVASTAYTAICAVRFAAFGLCAAGPFLYTVNTSMRIVVTCASDDPKIDRIYTYCQQHDINMHCSRYILVGDSYWTWRIDAPFDRDIFWLLVQYPDLLTVVEV